MTLSRPSLQTLGDLTRLAIAGLIVLALAGCSGVGGTDEVVVVDGTTVPARMQLATASVGGSYYPVGNAIAQILSDELPGVIVTAEVSSGSSQNIRMLDANQVDLGLGNAAITFPAIHGTEGFDRPFPVQAVISLQSSVMTVVTAEGSGISTLRDLVGKRVAVGPAGAGWDYFMRPVLEAHGVSYEDFQQIYEGQANAMELLADGAVDAVVAGGSVPQPSITSATATQDLIYLEFDAAALDSTNIEYPFIRKVTIPTGTYEGLDADYQTFDSGSAQVLVRSDADPSYVYLIAKTIYEHRDRIGEMHPAGREITPERAAMDIGIPYHEGSLQYFNEIGLREPSNGE